MTLTIGLLVALIVPIAFAVMSVRTGNYYYNLGVTGGCVALLLLSGQPMALLPLILSLLISIVGDYFMAHQQQSSSFYLYGMIGFFLAHACLLWYMFGRLEISWWMPVVAGALAIGYGLYLAMRILPNVTDLVMRIAMCAYASILVLAFAFALGFGVALLPRVLFALGVFSILFSDTVIAECDFAGEDRLSKLIMPSYFACHLLITASALVMLL